MMIMATPTDTKTAESLIASSRSFGSAQRIPARRRGARVVALQADRAAVADEEAGDEQEDADEVEADRDARGSRSSRRAR